jgi:hypothetical protein
MNTITIWILLATANGYVPIVVDRYANEKDCINTVAKIEQLSVAKRNMQYMKGICVQSTVLVK